MKRTKEPYALLITVVKTAAKPWWWKHVDHDALPCRFEYEPIVFDAGPPKSLLTWRFWSMCVQCASIVSRARRRGCRYIFTFECGWLSFLVAGLQTLLGWREPRHVILQFIMREKTNSLKSRVKYRFMKWCFSSVYLCICSSRPEVEYYQSAFGWPASKLDYVPLHSDPGFLERGRADEENFVLSAGRTFRDYKTLLAAFENSPIPLKIVASRSSIEGLAIPPNVSVQYELPIQELIGLIARSLMVVVPLEDRRISIGQSVVLEAMSMAKPVVVTRVNGTVDYIEHMKTGLFVPPYDARAMRDAVQMLAADPDLRRRMGEAGLERIKEEYLPCHYAESVSRLLAERRAR